MLCYCETYSIIKRFLETRTLCLNLSLPRVPPLLPSAPGPLPGCRQWGPSRAGHSVMRRCRGQRRGGKGPRLQPVVAQGAPGPGGWAPQALWVPRRVPCDQSRQPDASLEGAGVRTGGDAWLVLPRASSQDPPPFSPTLGVQPPLPRPDPAPVTSSNTIQVIREDPSHPDPIRSPIGLVEGGQAGDPVPAGVPGSSGEMEAPLNEHLRSRTSAEDPCPGEESLPQTHARQNPGVAPCLGTASLQMLSS